MSSIDRFVNERPTKWLRYSGSGRVIVLVHGFLSNGSRAWRARGADWPRVILEDPQLAGWDVARAEWYSTLFAQDSGVEKSGEVLYQSLAAPRNSMSPLLAREILFVGHSMGGLVTRAMLVAHPELLVGRRVGVFTLGTPAHGVELARLLDFIEPLGHGQARDLQSQNETLAALHESFGALVAAHPDSLMGHEMVEEHLLSPARAAMRWVDRLTGYRTPPLVTLASQGGYFGPPQVVRLSDHASLSRPGSADDPVHRALVEFGAQFGSS